MSDLSQYIGCEIEYIVLVERSDDGSLYTENIESDEKFTVDDEGHLYYSSIMYGIMDYDDSIGKYVESCHYVETEHDFIGFLEICTY